MSDPLMQKLAKDFEDKIDQETRREVYQFAAQELEAAAESIEAFGQAPVTAAVVVMGLRARADYLRKGES